MGKVTKTRRETVAIAIAMDTKGKKKKKGRPSLADLRKREIISNNEPCVGRHSCRRNSNFESEKEDEDEDERKQKKVKLFVRLPQQSNQNQTQHLENSSSAAESESELGDNHQASIETMKISSGDALPEQEERPLTVTDAQHESPLVSGPTTPLPDKKILVFILDRLQKKDTYGVFSDPVDSNELPDYHEIIKHPMDFGTLRKKLDGGHYSNLEELEADVFLICSNAMQYNAADTVYYRQARSIQDLARRDFENLRHEGEDGAPQPKVVRRGRPPSKNIKKSVENSPIDSVVPEHSSGATLASGDDKAIGSSSYNLRRGPMLSSTDASFAHRSRNGENYFDWSTDWNNEFPANILKADMKYGKKHFSINENRRDTYQQFNPSASYKESSVLWNTDRGMKQLMTVGVHVEQHAYARSLARFAANLGPVVWEVASKKLENILPPGVKFGPGWVGEDGGPIESSAYPTEIQKLLDNSIADPHSNRPVTPTPLGSSSAVMCKPSAEIFEAFKRLNGQHELIRQDSGDGGLSWLNLVSTPAPHKAFLQPRKDFNGMFGQVELSRFSASNGQSGLQEASRPNQVLGGMLCGRENPFHPNNVASAENKLLESWATLYSGNSSSQGKNPDFCKEQNVRLLGESGSASSIQQRSRVSIPPDLNVQVQTSCSPSASL